MEYFFLANLSGRMERNSCLPDMILSRIICTWRSRSGLVCSCQKPTTWPNSCTTIPNLSQFFPILIACGPFPLFPTNEQHLSSKLSAMKREGRGREKNRKNRYSKRRKKEERFIYNWSSEEGLKGFCFGKRNILFALANSPARPLGEQYIIRMLLGDPLHEFDASEILPVSHRLFEQSFVGAWKVSIDLVRDHPVIPYPFLASCRSPPRPTRKSLAFPRPPVFPLVLHVVELDRT